MNGGALYMLALVLLCAGVVLMTATSVGFVGGFLAGLALVTACEAGKMEGRR